MEKAMRKLGQIIEAAKAGAYDGERELLVLELLLLQKQAEGGPQEPRRADWEAEALARENVLGLRDAATVRRELLEE